MQSTKSNSVLSMIAAAVLASLGCSPAAAPNAAPTAAATAAGSKETAKHDHGHGPNGGVVFDFGSNHVEFTVDHDKKECTFLFLAADGKAPGPVAAKDLTLDIQKSKTKEGKETPAMTIKMLPKDEAAGKAATYVGTDPGLGNVADFAGAAAGIIEGKPASGEFKE